MRSRKETYSETKRIKFINVYGPTECTCICSSHDVKKSDVRKMNELLPLGKMNENFSYSISNNELVLKGPNVGKGYYNNIKQTSEKFFLESDTTYLNKRCYKTGDIVIVKNGILYFKGRLDNQIKRMGYRIELEDIENNINTIKNVSKSVALCITKNESNKIILFIEVINKSKIPIQKEINKLLPKYMQPDEVFFINKIPMNQNGKINRRSLYLKTYK
jgi:D-alanine--poly(phosphoribitol) ligase subunit 1